jgi:O-antigen/teichoic acid export membrane protein
MNTRKIGWNATIAIIQVIASAVTLVILYKYILDVLGIGSLGIWSVVLAITSLSNIGQFGLSGSVIKFVAKYLARNEFEKVEQVLKTAFSAVSVILFFSLIVIYYPSVWILGEIIPEDSLEIAISLLPFALASMWLGSVSSIFLSGLDGCQRVDVRSLIMILAVLLFTVLAINLIPKYGLIGLAYAQILQNIFILITGWLFIRKELSILTLLPIGWNYSLFIEMIRYGINFQIGTLAIMFLDPVTKMLMTKFGGLGATGFFEMANKMVLQFRAIIVAANQVLVPVIATMKEKELVGIKKVYIQSFNFVLILTLMIYSFLIVITPYVSEFWIGRYEPLFIFFSFMAILGWAFSTLSVPAYFNNLGTGNLFWNTVAHIIIGIINISIGYLSGYFFGTTGVILSYVFAIIVGSLIIFIMYSKNNNISIFTLLKKDSMLMLMACSIGCILGMAPYYLIERVSNMHSSITLFSISIALYLIPVLLALKGNHQVINLKNIIHKKVDSH